MRRDVDLKLLNEKILIVLLLTMIFAFVSIGVAMIRLPNKLKGGVLLKIYEMETEFVNLKASIGENRENIGDLFEWKNENE